MPYQPYFSLSIRHHYYQQQDCADFTIEPTQACLRLLQRHRLILKVSADGMRVLTPIGDDQRPLVPLSSKVVFRFLLKLNNSEFTSFTELAPDYRPGQSFYAFSSQDLTGDSTLKPQISQFADLTPESESSLAARFAAIAELHSIQRGQIFGLVEIYPSAKLNQELDFKISFSAKRQIWHYYLIADRSADAAAFSIRDDRDDEAKQQQPALSFSKAEDDKGDRRILASIQQQFPGSQTLLLRSDQPVTCQDIGRANLQLIKQGDEKQGDEKQGDEKAWIPHLPNPPNQHGIQVINLLTEL